MVFATRAKDPWKLLARRLRGRKESMLPADGHSGCEYNVSTNAQWRRQPLEIEREIGGGGGNRTRVRPDHVTTTGFAGDALARDRRRPNLSRVARRVAAVLAQEDLAEAERLQSLRDWRSGAVFEPMPLQ